MEKLFLYVILPPLVFHLAGCGLLLLFEKPVHPWRHLGNDRERHCWGKLEGTNRRIKAEPTIWDQVSLSCFTTLIVYILTLSGIISEIFS